MSKKLYRRARIIGAAIRAAHMLSIGRPGIIDETPLAYERNKLVLTVPKAYAALDGERLRRRFAALAAPARARAGDPRQIDEHGSPRLWPVWRTRAIILL